MKRTRNTWRVLALVLALVMLFAVVACTGTPDDPKQTTAGNTTAAKTTTAKTTTAKKTQAATTTVKTTEKPVDPVDPATVPIQWDAFTKANFSKERPAAFGADGVIAINCADLENGVADSNTTVTDNGNHYRYASAGPVAGKAGANGTHSIEVDGIRHYYIEPKDTAGDFSTPFIRWTFSVPADGWYDVCFYLRLKNGDFRTSMIQIDEEPVTEQDYLHYTLTADEVKEVRNNDTNVGTYLTGYKVYLTAGDHTWTHRLSVLDEGKTAESDNSGPSFHYRKIFLAMSPDQNPPSQGGAVVDPSIPTVDVSGGEYNAETNPNGTYSIATGISDSSWYDNDPDSTGAAGADGKYEIHTADQLLGLFVLLNRKPPATEDGSTHVLGQKYTTPDSHTFEGKTIYFMRDFIINEVAGEGETPVVGNLKGETQTQQIASNRGYFAGTIEGNGHVISGLYQKPTSNNRGFFGPTYNGTFKNFSIINSYMDCTNDKHAAGLNVFGAGTITYENLYLDIDVIKQGNDEAPFGTAGFLGYVKVGAGHEDKVTTNIVFKNCTNAGDISTDSLDHAGGFIGKVNFNATVTFENCKNKGNITAGADTAANNAGGFIGTLSAGCTVTFTNCENTGTTTAASNTGDFVGLAEEGSTVEGLAPAGPVVIPTLGPNSFTGTKPESFNNAVTFNAGTMISDAVTSTLKNEEKQQHHLVLTDPTKIPEGPAAHGIFKLKQGTNADGSNLFHYYVDVKNIKNLDGSDIAKEDAFMTWTFEITEAGTYNMGMYIRLKDPRICGGNFEIDGKVYNISFDMKTDTGYANAAALDEAGKRDGTDTQGSYVFVDGFSIELAAGTHTMTYTMDADHGTFHFRDFYFIKEAAPAA